MDITVLNASRVPKDVLDVFSSVLWTDRYIGYGDFEIYLPIDNTLLTKVAIGFYLTRPGSDSTMVVETVEVKTDLEQGNFFIVRGRSLESILDRRIVWNQTILDGNFQDEIERVLNENAISPTDPDRQIADLVFVPSVDPFITGLTINMPVTGANLYDVIKTACTDANIGFKIILYEGIFYFYLYRGIDRSHVQLIYPQIIFSRNYDNLTNSDFVRSTISLKTTVLVGGVGDGVDRLTATVVREGYNADLDRRETYEDATDIPLVIGETTLTEAEYLAILSFRGEKVLETSEVTELFDAKLNLTQGYIYGVDYYLGDIVSLVNPYGQTGRSRVTELIYSESTAGISVYPTLSFVPTMFAI